jgi:hypothetical protein
MIKELANLLEDFSRAANQTSCFLHILNLVVKSIIKQFDLPKAQANGLMKPRRSCWHLQEILLLRKSRHVMLEMTMKMTIIRKVGSTSVS